MIPGQFDYVRPGNLDETLRILKDREGEAKLLSGGYSLLPLIKLRLAQPALLVDLRDVAGLDGIIETDDYLSIGAQGDPPPDPRGRDRPRPLPAPPRRHRARSATRRSATGARSAAPSPMPTRRRTGRPSCSRQRDDRLPQPGRRARHRGPRLLRRHVPDRHRADRGADRDPHPAPAARHRRRLREARAQGRRLRDRRRRGGRPARRGRSDRAAPGSA